MDPAPLLIAQILGLFAGLLAFAGLLLAGVRVVGLLGLAPTEADLPPELRFEPPAPPVRRDPDGPAARLTAAGQARRRAAYRTAFAAWQEAHAVDGALAGLPDGHPRLAELRAFAATAAAAAAAAEAAMLQADADQAEAATAAALAQARQARAGADALLAG